MTVEPGYPVTLVHPRHVPAKIATGNEIGVPERFPAITVNGALHEAQYRSQGYLRYGEPMQQEDYHEFPKILRHPEYREAIPSRVEAKIEDGRITGTFTIPATPAEYPDVTVNNEDEETSWRDKGYLPAGDYNKDALDSVLTGTIHKEAYVATQYPMWVDGKLIAHDPDGLDSSPDPNYPKFENGTIVPDPRFPPVPDPNKYPMWVHKDGIPSEESELAETPEKEFKIRQKWVIKAEQDLEEINLASDTSDQNPVPISTSSSKSKTKQISI
jgi:hypothetical protein